MEFTAIEIAGYLGGAIEGNENVIVSDFSKIEEGKKGTLSFLANPKYETYVYTTKASIVIVNKDFKPIKPVSATLIRVENAYEAFASLLQLYEANKPIPQGIEQPSFISQTAKIGEDVYIGAFAYIGKGAKINDGVKIYPQSYVGENVIIDKNTILYPNVKIYAECKIGAECIIHSGAVIGSDGFGFVPKNDENYKKIPQIGNVVLENGVEIGANTCIDRATIGSTIIKKGVKLDNLIQIAHNVEVGNNTVMAAQTGVAGSTKIGDSCTFGGQVGISGHLQIAKGTKIGAQAGLGNDIKTENKAFIGSPAFDYYQHQKSYVMFKNLPKFRNQILALEKELKKLKNKK